MTWDTSGSLADAVDGARVLVTTGAGGVGKTTTAAALGMAAAARGRNVLVITIDPARRLAQALGLADLAAEPQPVALTTPADTAGIGPSLEALGVGAIPVGRPGRFDAMMLDMESTFDDLIERHAANPEAAAAIRGNRIYQTLSSTLSGTQEYMAMEKLHELHQRNVWDLIVVDTPPTRSALDFLDAPHRMTSFLEGRLLRLLIQPAMSAGKGYMRAVGLGATAFMRIAGRVTGMEVLDDIAEFFRAFDGMYDGFKERATAVLALLQRPSSQFVVVASPQPPPLREGRFFVDRLEQEGLHLAGVVVNRVLAPDVSFGADTCHDAATELGETSPEHRALAAALSLAGGELTVAERQRRDVEAALVHRNVGQLVTVPRRPDEVNDLAGLAAIARHLLGDSSPLPTSEPAPHAQPAPNPAAVPDA